MITLAHQETVTILVAIMITDTLPLVEEVTHPKELDPTDLEAIVVAEMMDLEVGGEKDMIAVDMEMITLHEVETPPVLVPIDLVTLI